MKKLIKVKGMTCAVCVKAIEDSIRTLPGIDNVYVDLIKGLVKVNYDESIIKILDIYNKIKVSGYEVIDNSNNSKDNDLIKLIISIILNIIIMYFSMGNLMWNFPTFPFIDSTTNPTGFALIQLILTLPVVYIYKDYFIRGFKVLFKGKPNMDSLIATGALFSILYGIYSIFMLGYTTSLKANDLIDLNQYTSIIKTYSHNLYFESAAMILTLVSVGKYLEKKSIAKTTKSITKLIDATNDSSIILINNKEVEVPTSNIKIGDLVVIKEGMKIMVDGIIQSGNASINEAYITGESIPVYKSINDTVLSGGIINSGYIVIKATKESKDSTLEVIVRMVEEATSSKAHISRLADKVAGVFVPIILTISLITFIANLLISNNTELAFNFAISVIVIACPCSLGLATPVAITVSSGVAASAGMIIKNANVFEKANKIDTIVFDKTGTITKGVPLVKTLLVDEDILNDIYNLERISNHPLSKAITLYISNSINTINNDVYEYELLEGKGIKGITSNNLIYIGNDSLLSLLGISATGKYAKYKEDAINNQDIYLYIIKNNTIVGFITIIDEVRNDAKEAISIIKKSGIHTIMLTGDNEQSAKRISSEVGIDEVYAKVLPIDKKNIINKLEQSHHVCMVGDGVNDSLALSYASLSISLSNACDIAKDSSDIVLLSNNIIDVVNAINLSHKTLKTIKVNLFFAFVYNLICVIIASGALYYITNIKINPMIASLAMSLSSISVVLNALTINRFKKIKHSVMINNNKEITKTQKTTKLVVLGMMCEHCEKKVEKACMEYPYVTHAKASHKDKTVSIDYINDIDIEGIINNIKKYHYDAHK